MAMAMSGEATLPAARPKVWALLNDPAVLKASIPGCESLERTGDNGFAAVAKVKIGPVSSTFKGKVTLSDIVPNVGYTITGEGEGGVAGFAKGQAKVSLADVEGGTLLHYDVEASVGGKIAQLGSRLIDGVAKNMADKFFVNFAQAAGGAEAVAGADVSPAPAAKPLAMAAAPAAAPAAGAPRPAVAPPPSPPAAPPGAAAQQTMQTIPTKTSWLRRILEWFKFR
jgi:carbon monoxide dehydrogenase subunit G